MISLGFLFIFLDVAIPCTIYTAIIHFSSSGVELAMYEDFSSLFLTFVCCQCTVNTILTIPMAKFSSNNVFKLANLKYLECSVGKTGMTTVSSDTLMKQAGYGYPFHRKIFFHFVFASGLIYVINCVCTTFLVIWFGWKKHSAETNNVDAYRFVWNIWHRWLAIFWSIASTYF